MKKKEYRDLLQKIEDLSVNTQAIRVDLLRKTIKNESDVDDLEQEMKRIRNTIDAFLNIIARKIYANNEEQFKKEYSEIVEECSIIKTGGKILGNLAVIPYNFEENVFNEIKKEFADENVSIEP